MKRTLLCTGCAARVGLARRVPTHVWAISEWEGLIQPGIYSRFQIGKHSACLCLGNQPIGYFHLQHRRLVGKKGVRDRACRYPVRCRHLGYRLTVLQIGDQCASANPYFVCRNRDQCIQIPARLHTSNGGRTAGKPRIETWAKA